nr:reverse transcriptase domain-containing protein [Tanacetum cinerariifolium]
MSTRSSVRNLFPPLDNPELTIRRRPRVDPTLLNDFEMATDGNGDPPVPDLQTMEELCQPTLNGRGHLDKFLHDTQSTKVNRVTDDTLRLYLFPHSLTHHATTWFDHFQRNSINTFEQMAKMFLGKYFPPSMVTKLRNEITNFRQRFDELLFEAWERYKLSIDRCLNHNMLPITQIDAFYNGLTLRHRDTINAAAGGTFMKRRPNESESSSSITSSFDPEIVALKAEMAEINKNLMKVLQINQQVKAVAHNCETYGGPHSYNDCPAIVGQTQNVYAVRAYNQGGNSFQPQVVTTTEFTNYMKANDADLKNMQTNMTSLINSKLELKNMFGQFMKMNTASSSGLETLPSNTITNPNEDLKGITTQSGNAYKGPTIPTTSSLPKVVERETEGTNDTVPPTNNESTKNVQPLVFQIENPIPNSEPIVAPVVAPVSAPKPNPKPSILYSSRLHDLRLRRMDECLALADLGASINLMPLSVWNKLSLPELSPTFMTLELADRSISHPDGVAKDFFVKTRRALIDVYEGELTLRVGNKSITFNLDQTSRYSSNYDAMSVNQIDLIDVACKEYSQEVLGFFVSGNPTPSMKPIVSNSSPTLTAFGDSDFLLEETDAFLAIDDELISPVIDDYYYDSEGDILLLEEFFNDDPSSPPPPPQELKVVEPTNEKSFIDEPPVVKLKDLPPHLEYVFLKGDDKLPIIISKDLKDEKKTTLIKVLKSHKQALAWQLFDIKGINPEFYTY